SPFSRYAVKRAISSLGGWEECVSRIISPQNNFFFRFMEIKLLLHPLTKSIKNMKVLFIAMLMSISIVGVHQINAKEIQGIVYQASDNTALAGVSVSNKRINATAMTDKNGAFTIEALEGDELLFQAV